MTQPAKWLDSDHNPTEPGWYPVALCWDTAEGIFPSAAHWDGNAWSETAVLYWIDRRCQTLEAAHGISSDNDEWD